MAIVNERARMLATRGRLASRSRGVGRSSQSVSPVPSVATAGEMAFGVVSDTGRRMSTAFNATLVEIRRKSSAAKLSMKAYFPSIPSLKILATDGSEDCATSSTPAVAAVYGNTLPTERQSERSDAASARTEEPEALFVLSSRNASNESVTALYGVKSSPQVLAVEPMP
jgi:hypothetical protein